MQTCSFYKRVDFTHVQFFAVNKHELPVGQMGNYQEHLKKINPLREVDSGLVRTQLFGNPFKLEKPDKVFAVMVSLKLLEYI